MKDKIISILFIVILVGLMIYSIILPDKEVSVSERRKLQQLPKVSVSEVFKADYFSELGDYLVEQFPFRDTFRKIKGLFLNKVFRKNDNNGVFVYNDGIYKLDSEINKDSVNHMVSLINEIIDKHILSDKIYFSIIPDKNYFLDDDIPKLDYKEMEDLFREGLHDFQYINLFNFLDIDDYYKTDIHFRQEKLEDIVVEMRYMMGLDNYPFKYKSYSYDKFYGALYGQVASTISPDELIYLSNDTIDNALVYDYEKSNYISVYDKRNLSNIDSYDIYLSGAKALLIIENKEQDNDRELVIFRDSFGSSLVPLLIENYEKITMIDLRYLKSNMLDKIDMINFDSSQDVLFIYSSSVINDSFTLN